MSDQLDDDEKEYIRKYRHEYTRESINKVLKKNGATAEQIDAAWKEIEPIEERDDDSADSNAQDSSSRLGVWFYVRVALLFVIPSICLVLTNTIPRYSPVTWLSSVNILFVVSVVLAFFAAPVLLRNGWSRRKIFVLLITMFFVWEIIIVGACFFSTGV